MANRFYFVRSSRGGWLLTIRVAPTPQAQACAVFGFGRSRAPSWLSVVTRLTPTLSGFPTLWRWLHVYRNSAFLY